MRPVAFVLLCSFSCVVPKRGGFDEVQKLAAAQGIEHKLFWSQSGKDEQQLVDAIDALLAQPLSVEHASEIALLRNPRLQATYERLGVAAADLVQAGLLRNPSLSLSFGFPFSGGGREYEFSLVEEFLDLFLIPLKKRMARAELEAAELEVAGQVIDLDAEVRTAYYSVKGADQILKMEASICEAAVASAELAEKQFRAGNVSELDRTAYAVLQAETELLRARAESRLTDEREKLNRLLGLFGHQTEWILDGGLDEPPKEEPSFEHLESFAIAHRFDLKVERKRAQSLAAALGIAKAGILGGLELGLHGHQDSDQGVRLLGPSLRLEIPIFDQRQALRARLWAELRRSWKLADALAIDIRSTVRAARSRVLSDRAVVLHYRDHLLPLKQRLVALTQQHYNAMLAGVYQLLSARSAEAVTYREYILAVRDYWIARTDLDRIAGARVTVSKDAVK